MAKLKSMIFEKFSQRYDFSQKKLSFFEKISQNFAFFENDGRQHLNLDKL
jgi:hypothetical protein